MDIFKKEILLITCARAIAPYLRKEVEALNYTIKSEHNTGIELSASFADSMKLNLCLRTAYGVLYLLKQFSCRDAKELYEEVFAIPWEELIEPSEYLSVVSRVDTPSINNSVFASQKAKDAIVDRIANKCGSRPSAGASRENVVVNLYWKDRNCWIYINTSGRKLSDRNYRKIPYKAPLQETLAAALLQAAGYDGRKPLVNPMCGSGTIAIEAALIALARPPAELRRNFGFMHIKGFDAQNWQNLRKKICAASKKNTAFKIIASDIDKEAVESAKKNAKAAKVEDCIEFHICDFKETPIPCEKGIVFFNPEYGLRMGNQRKLENTYKEIGDFLKQKCSGFKGYVFTGNKDLAKCVGLRAKRRLTFFNAEIECRLLEYEMYEGSVKKSKIKN
ncbi:MAG: class I SAM-dependent RNA methyltransferase [Candidatus Omnitrophota bacterium]